MGRVSLHHHAQPRDASSTKERQPEVRAVGKQRWEEASQADTAAAGAGEQAWWIGVANVCVSLSGFTGGFSLWKFIKLPI